MRIVEFMRQLWQGIRQAWAQLSLTARVNIVLASLTVAVLIGLSVYFGARPQYVTLVSDIEPANLAKITDALTAGGVTYRLDQSNTVLQVPLTQRSQAQLLLAEKDLPVGRRLLPGFELFAQTELMTNQWLQDVKFMRALQGEIQRQLNAFDFIEDSYVLIREAKEELFAADQKPSEAAVTLKTTRPLTKREVKAIVSIVDHAGGPNLHPGNITVTTTRGEVLYLPPENTYAALASSKLEFVAELEKQREAKLRDTLREMGVRGTVSVSAVVDFDQKEVTDDQISAGTELSTYTTETSSTGSDVLPQGTPGATANLPESAASGGTSTNEKTSEEIINYEPSRRMTRTRTDPGDVVKYIVTLVVEGEYKQTQSADGSTGREYAGLSESRRQLFIDLAKAAVGEGRSPTEVQLYDQPFNIEGLTPEGNVGAVVTEMGQTVSAWLWPATQILLIIGAFMLVRRALARAVYVAKPIEEEEEAPVELPEATREDLRRQEVEQEIFRLSQEQPDVVAALIRNWLAEEEE